MPGDRRQAARYGAITDALRIASHPMTSATRNPARRAVITGATSGIGEAIARTLAADCTTVVMVGRSAERLRQARRRILAALPDADLHLERADLSLLEEVRQLAEHLARGQLPDVVISSASVIADVRDVTSEGLQRTLATNHLAPYLLLRLLTDAIGRRSARFVVIGADPNALARVPVDLDDLRSENERWHGDPPSLQSVRAYGRTKNMNAMFVYGLARRLEGTRITVNGAHPGIVGGTGLGRDLPGVAEMMTSLLRIDTASLPGPEAGADTPVWLATSPAVDGVSGRFFVDRKEVTTAPHTTDVARCDRLWDETARLVDLPQALRR
jgi:NAD(P)-dependent dehydrogenase (short-subunit alcohol dehydrogenase family)